ncbi:MAG: PEP-CTERM sorting domain-containing protein [Chitinophagaceae bacterium]|nr:PEP-CTERM sorting domain-containing protein [Rubrivivax sp.]
MSTSVAASEAGSTVWSYALGMQPGHAPTTNESEVVLFNGGYFRLLGFAGYVEGSCIAPDDFVCRATPAAGDHEDDESRADRSDLTWIYSGKAKLGGDDLRAIVFSAASIHATEGALDWASGSAGHRLGTPLNAGQQAGLTRGPSNNRGEVPEPASLALTATGLALLLVRRKKRTLAG